MNIHLTGIAKRYRYEWIFRHLDYHFQEGKRYAILGPNGSGKSTLMRIISGHLSPSKGTIRYAQSGRDLSGDEVYTHISYAAPYIELIEELTLSEALSFHQHFKPLLKGLTSEGLIDLLRFQKAANKQVRHFSSGMKQRLKLVLAICSDTPVLLLDEPTTNLDRQGIDWYLELIERFGGSRLVIVASNVAEDYQFCDEQVEVSLWKKGR